MSDNTNQFVTTEFVAALRVYAKKACHSLPLEHTERVLLVRAGLPASGRHYNARRKLGARTGVVTGLMSSDAFGSPADTSAPSASTSALTAPISASSASTSTPSESTLAPAVPTPAPEVSIANVSTPVGVTLSNTNLGDGHTILLGERELNVFRSLQPSAQGRRPFGLPENEGATGSTLASAPPPQTRPSSQNDPFPTELRDMFSSSSQQQSPNASSRTRGAARNTTLGALVPTGASSSFPFQSENRSLRKPTEGIKGAATMVPVVEGRENDSFVTSTFVKAIRTFAMTHANNATLSPSQARELAISGLPVKLRYRNARNRLERVEERSLRNVIPPAPVEVMQQIPIIPSNTETSQESEIVTVRKNPSTINRARHRREAPAEGSVGFDRFRGVNEAVAVYAKKAYNSYPLSREEARLLAKGGFPASGRYHEATQKLALHTRVPHGKSQVGPPDDDDDGDGPSDRGHGHDVDSDRGGSSNAKPGGGPSSQGHQPDVDKDRGGPSNAGPRDGPSNDGNSGPSGLSVSNVEFGYASEPWLNPIGSVNDHLNDKEYFTNTGSRKSAQGNTAGWSDTDGEEQQVDESGTLHHGHGPYIGENKSHLERDDEEHLEEEEHELGYDEIIARFEKTILGSVEGLAREEIELSVAYTEVQENLRALTNFFFNELLSRAKAGYGATQSNHLREHERNGEADYLYKVVMQAHEHCVEHIQRLRTSQESENRVNDEQQNESQSAEIEDLRKELRRCKRNNALLVLQETNPSELVAQLTASEETVERLKGQLLHLQTNHEYEDLGEYVFSDGDENESFSREVVQVLVDELKNRREVIKNMEIEHGLQGAALSQAYRKLEVELDQKSNALIRAQEMLEHTGYELGKEAVESEQAENEEPEHRPQSKLLKARLAEHVVDSHHSDDSYELQIPLKAYYVSGATGNLQYFNQTVGRTTGQPLRADVIASLLKVVTSHFIPGKNSMARKAYELKQDRDYGHLAALLGAAGIVVDFRNDRLDQINQLALDSQQLTDDLFSKRNTVLLPLSDDDESQHSDTQSRTSDLLSVP